MHAIVVEHPGGPEALTWQEVPDPVARPGEVLIRVAATALNRADLLQRQGLYPPPPGASEILGLECSGTVEALGEGVSGFTVGDEVCALLAGGGYAERVAVPAAQVLPIPEGTDLVAAASLPEVAGTTWSNLVMEAGMHAGSTVLIHGGSGGIGTFGIQLAHTLGATVFTTAGSDERVQRCIALGADVGIEYISADFVDVVREHTHYRGVDIILDNMGAKYLARNVEALAPDGHLAIIGMQGGATGELNIGVLLGKRGRVSALGLRGRPVDGPNGKGAVVAGLREHVWPLLAAGRIVPVIDTVLPVQEAARAHELLDTGSPFGKIVLQMPS